MTAPVKACHLIPSPTGPGFVCKACGVVTLAPLAQVGACQIVAPTPRAA